MGKVIEEKYRDVKHRIIKKSLKKEKLVKKASSDSTPTKRKLKSIDDEQPKTKSAKIDHVDFLKEKPKIPEIPQINVRYLNKITSPEIQVVQSNDGLRLEIKENKSRDLFLHDELSNSYENFTNNDLAFHILDEISLEGLDGITTEALWKRLLVAMQRLTYMNDDIKQAIWKFVCCKKDLKFFKLCEPRGVLDIYDRSKYLDADIGVIMELAYELPDIYAHELINQPNVQGSSSTFNTRTDVSGEIINMDFKTVEQQYGTAMVIVADQRLRSNALFDESFDPSTELVNMEYCILEKIGRSRKQGELTQGNMSIGSHFNMDPRSVFHYEKQLVQYKLLAKQFFYIKSAVVDHNKTGKLLHLRRFYHKIKPKQMLLAEQVINVMKERPDCRIEYSELRRMFRDFTQPLSKIFKSPEFRKYVRTQLICYRDMYPNAKKSEYMRKSKPIEKFIKCLELLNPSVNITATWCVEQDDSDDENEEEEDNIGGKIFNMESFKEVYYHVRSKGKDGCTAHEVQKLMGIDFNTVRMCLKKLVASNTVSVKKFDQGKQRHFLYYSQGAELEENKVISNPQPSKPKNDILAKIKERQRLAIEKSKQPPLGKDETAPKKQEFKWQFEPKIPQIICPFLISTIEITYSVMHRLIEMNFHRTERNYLIKLSTDFPKSVRSFEINKALKEISSEISPGTFKVNFTPDAIHVSKKSVNHMTKLILLKAAFGEVVINASTIDCFTRKRQFAGVPALFDMEKEKPKFGNEKLQYMGPAPVTVFSEKEGDVYVEIVMSTPPVAFKNESVYPAVRELSDRVLSRTRLILKIIYEKKIFEEVFKLIKVVEEEEQKDGTTTKIDRKSLARILKRLTEEGYLKIFKLSISNDKLTKVQTFVCVPSVSHTDSLIQSACQQLKWKYFVGTHKRAVKTNVPTIKKDLEDKIQKIHNASPFKQSDVMTSIMELKELNKMQRKEVGYKLSRQAGRMYGFKPKFIRMRVIHEFMYYLIYNYDRGTQALEEHEVEELFESYHIKVTQENLSQIPNVYCKEISWKMFIPPLPHHEGWMDGWALMCDVILRLPISVLCKIHNVRFDVSELLEILNHPIKRFYLVKDLPENVRSALLSKRKYLFDIHESMCRLAWCGLIQFGPHKYKEKDQVFVYLNRRASLFDTTTSEPAYNKTTVKDYRKLAFTFNGQADVDNYWFNAYGICLSTKLNWKVAGQLVTIFDPQSRPELMETLKSKTPEAALENDNGELPGDRRGAAGLDSSLWSHIIKNWFWASQKSNSADKPVSMGLRKEKLEKILPTNLSFNELHTIGQTNKVYLHKTQKEGKKPKLRKYVHVPLKPSKRVQKITRKIPFKPQLNKQKFDNLDKAILKKIGVKVRVKWNAMEDRVLLLSMAVSKFLNPRYPKKQMVPYVVVRDVLHRARPESKNKMSSAVQRRMKTYLEPRHQYLDDNVSQFFDIEPVSQYYSTLVNNLLKTKNTDVKPVRYTEAQLSQAFVILMSYLLRHPEVAETLLQGKAINIDHLTEDRLEWTENNLVPVEEVPPKYTDVKDEEDIKKDVLKSVIHSSLGCKNKPGWTFQLFKIYQRYSDNLICEALTELKRSQAISFKRSAKRKLKNRWHTPFQLSNMYTYSRAATFTVTTALETYKTFANLNEDDKLLNFSQEGVESKKYGQLLGLNEFCTFWRGVQFRFYLPRTMVILNPHIKDHDELIEELAVRWQAKLKRILQDNADTDLDQDNDNENRSKSNDFASTSTSSKENASISEADNSKHSQNYSDDQNNPLDLTVEAGDSETIDRLKHWVTDCMEAERERRSPSPEFINMEEHEETAKVEKNDDDSEQQAGYGYEEVDKINTYNLRKMLTKEQIPSLEEIKEGMLKYSSPNEERMIPYITELSSLLTRDFADSGLDEDKLERLKNHFITQYAVLEDVVLADAATLQDHFVVEYVHSRLRNQRVWEKITSNFVAKKPKALDDVYRALAEQNGDHNDCNLTERIVNFVSEKKSLGATAAQIREAFRNLEGTCTLELILQTLLDSGIFLRVGICSVTFVHYVHRSLWLVESFTLSNEELKFLEDEGSSQTHVRKNIEKKLEEKTLINVTIMPWVKVDGTLNEETFKSWLCNVLSHCVDHPGITFARLCEKFCYVKPVDIYYLVEILKELGCVDLRAYEETKRGVFSSWGYVEERDATFLDDFDNIYILPNNLSMTCMGSFFYQSNVII